MITTNLASARRRTDFFRAAGEGVWPPALAREVPPGEGRGGGGEREAEGVGRLQVKEERRIEIRGFVGLYCMHKNRVVNGGGLVR